MRLWSTSIAASVMLSGMMLFDSSTVWSAKPAPTPSAVLNTDWAQPSAWKTLVPSAVIKLNSQGKIASIDLTKGGVEWAEHSNALSSIDSLETLIANHPETPPEAMSAIAKIPRLKVLRIAGKAIDDSNIGQIASLTNVAVLALTNTNVTDQGIAQLSHWTKIKELSLVGSPVSGDVLKTFANCEQLTKLRIRNTSLLRSENVIQHLKQFSHLSSLELSESAIDDEALVAISQLPKLAELNLLRTKVTSQGLNAFRGRSLKRLNLDDIQTVDDQLFPILATLESLEWLHLGKTSITDTGLMELATHPSLKELLINDTGISETAVSELLKSRPMLKCVAP